MKKYVEVKILEKKSISEIIGDSLNLDDEKLLETMGIFEYNINPIIFNWGKYNTFLLMGEVQSGKTNNLIYLSAKLLESGKVNVVLYLTGTKNDLLNQNQQRFFDSFKEMGDSYQIYRNRNISMDILEVNKSKKIIINSLKTPYRLSNIKKLIESNSPLINYLVIDDEADEGSTSGATFTLLKELSIKRNVKYIGITATPFRNLYKHQDFYDYFHALKPGLGYQGFDSFNKSIKIIDDQKLIVTKAFIEWIIKCAITKKQHSQILFNIINLNSGHNKIFKTLKNILLTIKRFENLKKTIISHYPEAYIHISEIAKFVTSLSVDNFLINNGDVNDEPKNVGHEVVIGGLKLSRGITYKNLISEVMINMGQVVEPGTLVQRARWLGYGKKIDDVDIYMNSSVKSALDEAEDLIDMTRDFTITNEKYKDLFDSMNYGRLKLK